MAKSELSTSDTEALAMQKLDQKARAELDPTDPENFNIVKGMPLPEGFVNPELGKEGRCCLDIAGNYDPEWSQVKIQKTREKQRDPQTFPLGKRWAVYLDTWTDVPPDVLISLGDAIEIHHESTFTDDSVKLGVHPETTPIPRQRFFWMHIKSA